MKYKMKNETHEQRSERFKKYYAANKEAMAKLHHSDEENTYFAKNMLKKGGNESRERFVKKRQEIKQLAGENGYRIKNTASMPEKDLDKTLNFLRRLTEERGKMKK